MHLKYILTDYFRSDSAALVNFHFDLFIYFTVRRETAYGFKPTQTSFLKARRESLREKYEISNQDVKIENEKKLTKR